MVSNREGRLKKTYISKNGQKDSAPVSIVQLNFLVEILTFSFKKWIWKRSLQHGGHFASLGLNVLTQSEGYTAWRNEGR